MELIKTDCHSIRKILADRISERVHLVGSESNLLEMMKDAEDAGHVELTRDQALDLGIIIAMLEARYADYDEIDRVSRDKYDYFHRLDEAGIDAETSWGNHEYPDGRDMEFYMAIAKAQYNYKILSEFMMLAGRDAAPNTKVADIIIDMARDITENMGQYDIPDMLGVDPVTLNGFYAIMSRGINTHPPRVVGDVIDNAGSKISPIEIPGIGQDAVAKFIESIPLNRGDWNWHFTGTSMSDYELNVLASKIAATWAHSPRVGMSINRFDCVRLGLTPEVADEIIHQANTKR